MNSPTYNTGDALIHELRILHDHFASKFQTTPMRTCHDAIARINDLSSKLEKRDYDLLIMSNTVDARNEEIKALKSRLDSVRRFAKERINITKDMGQPGEATGWLYVLRLVDGVVERHVPK